MGQEFELKYRTDPDSLERLRAAYPGEYETISMTTSYYDTPDGALSRRRWILRHRQEGARHVCTLKTPGDEKGRGEWECEAGDILRAIPLLIRKSAPVELEALTGNGLVRTCGAKFTRLASMISIDGATVELALDSGVLLNGNRELAFSEAELELKEGSREALVAFGQRFAERFGLEEEPESKFARARALGQER